MQRPAYFHAGAESTVYLARAPWKPAGRRAKTLTVGIAFAASQTGVQPSQHQIPKSTGNLKPLRSLGSCLAGIFVEQSID